MSPSTSMSTHPDLSAPGERVAAAEILPLILQRWSPRSFTDDHLPPEQLEQMLEAARWAPSSHNAQPWRFLYALRGDAHWDTFVALPNERNQLWCRKAAALLLLVSDSASRTHAFDAGCAWGYLALQAQALGWSTHAMAGFDAQRAREALHVPQTCAIQAMIAIGRRGQPEDLPPALREREQPSSRVERASTMFHGVFPPTAAADAAGGAA